MVAQGCGLETNTGKPSAILGSRLASECLFFSYYMSVVVL